MHDLVVALVRHAPNPADFDCAVLCDADLAMLAAEPQKYKSYLQDVRAEYAHLPIEDYLRARVRILHKLLARPSLFVSPLGAAWEEPARQNLSGELQRLEKELKALEARGVRGRLSRPVRQTPARTARLGSQTATSSTASPRDRRCDARLARRSISRPEACAGERTCRRAARPQHGWRRDPSPAASSALVDIGRIAPRRRPRS